jgi:hypothetical protein
MAEKKIVEPKAIPFQGGMNKSVQPALLPMGAYSDIVNMRQMHPGMKARPGQIKLHVTADGTNKVMSLFQFSKGKKTERHFYAQMSDGDVLEATTQPPGVGGGVFGTSVHAGTVSGMIPASWSNMNDLMIYSNGVDQHQINYGNTTPVDGFIVYYGAAAIPDFPILGNDYSSEVSDGQSSTVAVLDSLGDLAVDYDCVFIRVPVPIKQLTWTLAATTKGNTTAAVGQLKYRKNDNTWAAVAAFNDGTELLTLDVAPATPWVAGDTVTGQSSTKAALIVAVITTLTYQISGRTGAFTLNEVLTNGTVTADQGAAHPQVATLGYSGNMTFTTPTDSMPTYMFGQHGYWYQFSLTSGDLDSEVEVSAVTFEANWTPLFDQWDGAFSDCLEAQFNDVSVAAYYVYGGSSVTLNAMVGTDGTEDFLYLAFADPCDAWYIDVGSSPSTTGSNKIDTISYWNGAAWSAWAETTNYVDSTVGLVQSGFIGFPRREDEQPLNFNKTSFYAYWYKVTVKVTLSASVNIGFQSIPRLYIEDFGKGVSNCAWKGRMAYTFDLWPEYVYLSADGSPFALSGIDSAVMEVGDGRSNKTYMRPWYSELMCVQEERGRDGGTVSIIQGTRPENMGKLVLSTIYGVMNSQCLEVVNGFDFGNNEIMSAAFGLSARGIWISNGRSVRRVPGFESVECYFDPSDTTNCIRTGYESHMWLKYDSAYNILRIGLVTGASATLCNTWLIYDLQTKTFSRDLYTQELSCMTEVEAASGNVPILQVGGGVDDGQVYLLNSGQNDITTAVDAYVVQEFDAQGRFSHTGEMILRMKVQTAGDVTITPYENSIAKTAMTKSMTAEVANQTIRRHRFNVNLLNQHVSVKFEHNTASEDFYLLDLGLGIEEYATQ